MKQLLSKLGAVRETFWFLPAVMSALAVALSFLTVWLDEELGWSGPGTVAISNISSAEGARTLLATIAGSMITVASLTFTITITSLSLASSQFGPRLVRNFMRDTGNQIVLGTFIATFAYSLLILRTVRGADENLFVPSISIVVAVVLAMASLAVLIYFINHITLSIQASRIIGTIGRDLTRAIERLYPEHRAEDEKEGYEEDAEWSPQGQPRPIHSTRSGYLQSIQYDDLVTLASEASVVLSTPLHPGQFVAKGSTVAEVYGDSASSQDDLARRVMDAFWLGGDRSSGRDIEFYIDQLVEIAVRALSPGVNDPFTAMQCLDQMGASLRQLLERKLPSSNHRDAEGDIRLVAKVQTVEGAFGAAFNAIRQYGANSPSVMMRMLEMIGVLAEYATTPAHKDALAEHARMIERAGKEHLREQYDIESLERRLASVMEALEHEREAAAR